MPNKKPVWILGDQWRRLNFITGKGGVGKTTISCAIALKAAEEGLETLLLAVNPVQPLELLWGGSPNGPIDNVHEVRPGLSVFNLDQIKIFNNYIKKSMKIHWLYEPVLASPVYSYFTAIAPGIKELMTQDLIIQALSRTSEFGRRHYDVIFVDSPATGHGLSWFSVPDSVMATFPVGPLHTKAKRIKDIWLDPDQTSLHLVTLPEEMPINETIEFYTALVNKLKIPVKSVIVNTKSPDLGRYISDLEEVIKFCCRPEAEENDHRTDAESVGNTLCALMAQTVRFYQTRHNIETMYQQILTETIPLPLYEVPSITRNQDTLDFFRQIAQTLGHAQSSLEKAPL
ncbi:ArsA family ATPase [bacterium]|nr:ArsA family ATPase [bacterium]